MENMFEMDGYQESVVIALLNGLKDGEARHYYTDGWCLTLSVEKLKALKDRKPFPVTVVDIK